MDSRRVPRSFLAADEPESGAWRTAFPRAVLERARPQLGITVPPTTVQRFWAMVAHFQAGRWNAAEIASSLGVTAPTVNSYLDTMVDVLFVPRLTSWIENLKKRQLKAPKVYLSVTGLLHALLHLQTEPVLLGHPKSGASWEGFAMHEAVRIISADREEGGVPPLGDARRRGNRARGLLRRDTDRA